MKAKSTTGMAKEHELFVEAMFSWDEAKRSRSSGASFHDPIDITSNSKVIECEATENKSYRLTLDFWHEIVEKQHSGKQPMLAIRLRDAQNGRHVDLVVKDLHDEVSDAEELEAYRVQSLRPR